MRYYIGGMACDTNYLEHHGVKGQKWGVRRFQNEDGSLTPEGQARYGDKFNNRTKGTRNLSDLARKGRVEGALSGDNFLGGGGGIIRGIAGGYTNAVGSGLAGYRSKRLEKAAQKARANGDEKKAKKLEEKKAAQDASEANLNAYMDRTSTAKLAVQRILMGRIGSHQYRKARSRGASRVGAIFQVLDPTSISRMVSNKRAYGKALQWSAMDE